MNSALGLEGQIALVTGASRGLGRAIARKLCACGSHVYINYLRSDVDVKELLAELKSLPGTAVAIKGDVSDPAQFAELLDQVRVQHGSLDVFVHNAATFRPMSAVAIDPPKFLAEQALALNPMLYGAGEVVQLMGATGRGGRIIFISSNGVDRVVPGYVSVGVAKAGLESMARYLAVELAGQGIAVNVVATAMLDKQDNTRNRDIANMLAAQTPAGRLTIPEDVADAVALLCAPEAHWIHGQVLMVDGGLGLRA